MGGKDPDGIGFFSLEDKPNKDFNFTDTERFDVEFHPAIHFLSGPLRTDLPPRLFDLAFGVSMVTELATGIGVEANFNLGLFTDFEGSVRKRWRFPGRALAYVQGSGTNGTATCGD